MAKTAFDALDLPEHEQDPSSRPSTVADVAMAAATQAREAAAASPPGSPQRPSTAAAVAVAAANAKKEAAASPPGPVEVRSFYFSGMDEPYGFVNVGSKVCEVKHGTLAAELGVKPGWHVAAVDGNELPQAVVGVCRCAPLVSTEDLRECLRARRSWAVRSPGAVAVVVHFWRNARPLFEKATHAPEERLEAGTAETFRQLLVGKCGSIAAAWEALDKDGSGGLNYREFVEACRGMGFQGNLRAIFSEMDPSGDGVISIRELDPACLLDTKVGRCAVCTLPNPCPWHSDDEQMSRVRNMRNEVDRRAMY